jgi:hypothetical protein
MTGPIAIELVADPPAGAEAARSLLDACATAAGPAGCVLEDEASPAPRAHVLVVFSEGDLRLRVEVLSPVAEGASRPSRVATFRLEDPLQERFRAAGLIVAGLVAGEGAGPERTEGASESAPRSPIAPEPVSLRLGVGAGATAERSWGLALLGADLRIAGPLRVALDGGYAHTWSRDASGIAEARLSFGVGPAVALPLVPGLELRARLEGELQQLRADVVQPSTGREDASGRTLGGLATEADLQVSLGGGLELFAGDRLDFWGSRTTVRVQNAPIETIGGWLDVAVAGLNVRLP